jgi:hypothetical protein
MMFQGPAFLLAVIYWALTAFYGVLASQAFIQEQFLAPRLFAPLAFFADWHAAIGVAALAPWATVRLIRAGDARTISSVVASALAVALIAVTAPLSGAQTVTTSATIIVAGLISMALLVVAEWLSPASSTADSQSTNDRSVADLVACVLGAAGAAVAQSVAALVVNGGAVAPLDIAQSIRLHLLLAGAGFLCIAAVRAIADLLPRHRVTVERVATGALMAAAFAAFLFFVVLASVSIRGGAGAALAIAMGLVFALAAIARGVTRSTPGDGVAAAFSTLAPRAAKYWWGFAGWLLVLTIVAFAMTTASRAGDWNFVLARTGVVIVWMLALAGGVSVTRGIRVAGTVPSFAAAVVILIAHVSWSAAVPQPVAAALDPGARWLGEMLERPTGLATGAGADIVPFLHARTNIPRGTAVEPVDVNLASLTGEPSAQRPNIFVFVVDSLRRDYVSTYNPKVTFTPSIAALAADSLVFRNAFTQYGATGLSVPSLWVGGAILHKQYVTPFAPMNSLAKLLEHERYQQWIGMDNIMDVVLPASERRERLDPGVAIKDFRMCHTLDDIRSRLAGGTAQEPLFVYSLPQDVHVSVVSREGAASIDERRYEGFYAPVASRVARFDACLGAFVNDLKARGLYDRSIIILTSDHGDSLGEEGRMGHAYSLHPEIVRVPLIMHVPAALRSRWSWDEQRVAFTTDITPTLYRLLGHEPHAPAGFFGEPLAQPAGAPLPPPADRMVAASYGAVYGALLDGGRSYYVFDAIAMREMAFSIADDASPGAAVRVTGEIRQRGLSVIRRTVEDISSFYRYSPQSE